MATRPLVPTDLGTLPFWGDFQTSASVTKSGTNVTALAGRTGSQVPSVSAPGTAYPIFMAAGLNGFDCAQFAAGGLNSATLATPLAANTVVNWFFVGSLATGAAGYSRSGAFVPTAGSSSDAYGGISLLSTSTGAGQLSGYNLFNGVKTTAATANAVHVYAAYTLDGTTSNISVDAGAIVNSTSQKPYFNATLAGFNLGWSGGDGPWTGLIGEAFCVLGVMTQAQVDQAIGYLAWRWANTAPLPSGFAYKNAAPTVSDGGATLAASPGTFAITGQSATFSFTGTTTLPVSPGAFTISGQPATFANQSAGTLAASPGAFSVAGQPAAFSGTLAASPGTYSVSGQPATLRTTFTLPVAPGSYAVSGQPATFTQSSTLAASPGSFAITGQPATFNTQAPGTLAAAPGSFAVSGQQATFAGYLGAQPGTFSVSGKPATFTQATALAASPGSLVITGKPATFSSTTTAILAAQPGIYSITGQPVTFVGSGNATLAAQAGAFAITGGAATFQNAVLPTLAATFTASIANSFTAQIAGVFQ